MIRQLVAALLLTVISANHLMADGPPRRELPWGEVRIVDPDQEWWSETQAGWLGGLVGGSVGILGAVYGIAAGLGLFRRFILVFTLVMTCLGITLLLAGIGAVVTGQPYHVYFLPLLIGGIVAMVFGINYPMLKRRNEQLELQRMSALDW